jgi:hypothetical protein
MNAVGFHALKKPKTPTERLEETRARREKQFDPIWAVSIEIPIYEEGEICGRIKNIKTGNTRAATSARNLIGFSR